MWLCRPRGSQAVKGGDGTDGVTRRCDGKSLSGEIHHGQGESAGVSPAGWKRADLLVICPRWNLTSAFQSAADQVNSSIRWKAAKATQKVAWRVAPLWRNVPNQGKQEQGAGVPGRGAGVYSARRGKHCSAGSMLGHKLDGAV